MISFRCVLFVFFAVRSGATIVYNGPCSQIDPPGPVLPSAPPADLHQRSLGVEKKFEETLSRSSRRRRPPPPPPPFHHRRDNIPRAGCVFACVRPMYYNTNVYS